MSSRLSFHTPYVSAIQQSFVRVWRSITSPVFKMGLGRSHAKPFHGSALNLALGDTARNNTYLRGQFTYGRQSIDIGTQGDPWTIAVPSTDFAAWLHGFSWLEDVLGLKSQNGHVRGRSLVDSWIQTYGQWNDFAWSPDVLSERLFYWLAYWAPGLNKDKAGTVCGLRRASVLRQLKALRKSYKSVSPGLPKLRAAAAYTLAGARISEGSDIYLARGLDWLDDQIDLQILPDGGHVSRSPLQTFEAFKILLILDKVLQARGVEGSRILSRAIDRLAPAVTFFQHSDGKLAVFHGGSEGDLSLIKKCLAAAPGEAKPFGYCPHTGYQRVKQNETTLLMDTGSAPPRPFDLNTHMSPLAIEISTRAGRLIGSCGWAETQPNAWRRPVRSAAAHSTLVLDDKSPGHLLSEGWKSKVMGEMVDRAAGPTKATRKEQDSGIWLEAYHEGYRQEYGLAHRRRIYLSKDGDDLRGEDSLYLPLGAPSIRRDQVPFAIRFHLYPNVRVSLSQDQISAIIIQDGKAGWRLRSDGGPLKIEDSVYLGQGGQPIKTKQIVIAGNAYCDSDGETRSNRVRWSLRELKSRQS